MGEGVAGLLLTGGASRRMGRDKATLRLGRRTLAQHLGALLSAVVAPALEVGPGRSELPAVREHPAGGGPLAALAAGWSALEAHDHTGPVVVLACDLPALSAPVVAALAAWPGDGTVVPVVAGRPQPLCARLSAAAMAACGGWVRNGERSLRPLLERPDAAFLGPEEWGAFAEGPEFEDVDTPEAAARAALGR